MPCGSDFFDPGTSTALLIMTLLEESLEVRLFDIFDASRIKNAKENH